MRRWQRIWLIPGLAVVGLVAAACGGNAEPIIVTWEPSATFTAPAVTAVTPTTVSMVLPSPTPFPTSPLVSPTFGPSPTNPLAPTQSPAPATLTATFIPTLAGLSVEYFTTDVEAAKPGSNVTLYWSVRGADGATIYRVDADGERLWRWDVNKTGQITVSTRAGDRDVARFLLVAEASGTTAERPLLIPLSCPEIWFFDPAPDACPAAASQITLEAEQTFEHGRMIWVDSQDRIYVIFEDGSTPAWAQYPDNFNEGDPDRDDSLVPPAGLLQPVRGFGLVWRSNSRVQERLGWATGQEVGFDGMFQADSAELSTGTLYLRSREGGILALNGLTDEWELLPLAPAESGTS